VKRGSASRRTHGEGGSGESRNTSRVGQIRRSFQNEEEALGKKRGRGERKRKKKTWKEKCRQA